MTKQHVLTVEEQIRGVRAAMASPRTPPQLRNALKSHLAVLQKKLEKQQTEKAKSRSRRSAGLLDFLGL